MPKFPNRTLAIMDNLRFLLSLDDACIDLIAIDPPFGKMENLRSDPKPAITEAELGEEIDLFMAHTGRPRDEFPEYGLYTQVGDLWEWNRDISEKGSHAAFYREIKNAQDGSLPKRIHSVIEAVIATAGHGMAAYICFMAQRLVECHRVLKDTGSIYVHCDDKANSHLRMLLDAIFGAGNFRNEIVWHYGKWSNTAGHFQRNHDVLLFYSKTDDYVFNRLYSLSEDKRRKIGKGYQVNKPGGVRQLIIYDREKAAAVIAGGDYDRIVDRSDDEQGTPLHDTWNDINIINSQARERTGYATQKPLALYRRIIEASSNPGDVVLDIFAGCATTAVAAEGWMPGHEPRQWIACDWSYRSLTMIKRRFYQNEGLRCLLDGGTASTTSATAVAFGNPRLNWDEGLDVKPWRVIGPNDVEPREQVLSGPEVSERQRRDPRWNGNIPKDECKEMLLARFGCVCWGCNWQPKLPNGEPDPDMLEVEHLFAKRPDDGEEGGDDNLYNLGIACRKCNGVKGNRLTMTQLRDDRALKGLVWPGEDKRPHLERARMWAINEWGQRPRRG